MTTADLLRKKRDGLELSREELGSLLQGFMEGRVTDYQMAAFLMAVCINGMTPEETACLTETMVASGRVLCFDHLPGPTADKHSTGGVGDWISLALAPLVSANGVYVPMMAGRALGHTGGTLDKLESIPGYRAQLEPERFQDAVTRVGAVIAGQTQDLAPLDRKLYALRDVTGTVESIPLIVGSILSKKKAEGIDTLVMDVKCGRGAFMKTHAEALALAVELCRVGKILSIQVVAFITNMDHPLGNAIGNALEVEAAVECLKGKAPADSLEVLCTLATAMICLAGKEEEWTEGRRLIERCIADGTGLNQFKRIVEVQGGDIAAIEHLERLPRAEYRIPVNAHASGYLEDVDPLVLAYCARDLGAGRERAEDAIRYDVGIRLLKQQGDFVGAGESLALVHAAGEDEGQAMAEKVAAAYKIGEAGPPERKLIQTLVTSRGWWHWQGGGTWTEAMHTT